MNIYVTITKQGPTIDGQYIGNSEFIQLSINNTVVLYNRNILMLWRNKQNMTKKGAANIFNISPELYSKWEKTGKINPQAIVFIQEWYMNLPVSEFDLDTIESCIARLKGSKTQKR